MKRHCLALLLLALFYPALLYGQKTDTSVFSMPVELDTFVAKSGFDINAFIRRVKNDTTFYKAFKSMRLVPYTAVNDINVLGKNNTTIASLHSKTTQKMNKGCRHTEVQEQQITGDFYKRDGNYNYYTAKLFAYLFFAPKPVCNQNDIVAGSLEERGEGQMEKSAWELKQLIFNPGGKITGVPFMGSRESIFSPEEARKYKFKITRQQLDGVACFMFSITPGEGFEHKVLYNELTTWFRTDDYSIVARNYSLSYNTLIYDFDVNMKVRTRQIGKKLYPTSVSYDGNWHVFTRKREKVKFNIAITY
jgi:hypothetical protein